MTHRDALGVEAVHHRGQELQLVLNGMREEVGVDEDAVGGNESLVVLEEQSGRDLGTDEG